MAMTLLILFFGGLSEMSGRLMGLLAAQKELVVATQAILERSEQIRGVTYAQATDTAFLQSSVFNSSPANAAMLANPVETLTVSAFPPDGSTPSRLTRQGATTTINSNNPNLTTGATVRLDLQISWQGRGGRTRTRQVSMLVAKGGIST